MTKEEFKQLLIKEGWVEGIGNRFSKGSKLRCKLSKKSYIISNYDDYNDTWVPETSKLYKDKK